MKLYAALVCAARSCPPLRWEAYRGNILGKQLEEAMRLWLGRDDLNHLDPRRRETKISSVFNWYEQDFGKEGGVQAILAKYAPTATQPFHRSGKGSIEYLPYHWGLNDQSNLGREYKRGMFKRSFK